MNNVKITITCPSDYSTAGQGSGKVSTIKAIRTLFNTGLYEAKKMSEITSTQILDVSMDNFNDWPNPMNGIDEQCRILRQCGVEVSDSIHTILHSLRQLATEALGQGEDELANEILQLILAEKLRRHSTNTLSNVGTP